MKHLFRFAAIAALSTIASIGSAQTAKVVIDPGHGGSDPGATGFGQTEANNVLNTGLKFRDWLNADSGNGAGGGSWTTLMTRTTNVFVGLSARATYANNNGANRFMSIHNNACCGASGTETFSHDSNAPTSNDLRNKIQFRSVQAWGLSNRGNKLANFAVLRETRMPATLAELGFITHATDAGFLGNAGHQDNMAKHHMFALQNHYSIFEFTPGAGFVVGGSIKVRHDQLGGNGGLLGAPTTNELTTPNGIGRYNHFAGQGNNASIYWTNATGAWEIYGNIRIKWSELGWENGPNGFPTTGENPCNGGRYNHFQNGSIYWSPNTGAKSVVGAIHARWASLGWENSSLGFPTSDEYAIPGGRRSNFQGGTISWNASTGAVTIP